MLLIDNCVFQSLGSAGWLHLLKSFKVVVTTPQVSSEQHRTAPAHCRDAFKRAVKEGWIVIQSVPAEAFAFPRYAALRGMLGETDAGLIVWAKYANETLITDDSAAYDAAEALGVKVGDIVLLLTELRDGHVFEQKTLEEIVEAIEKENHKTFSALDRKRLGIVPRKAIAPR